jgi:acetyl-CoA acetyltransferase family protein
MLESAYVLGATRTPFGRYGKGLAKIRPDDLAAASISELVAKYIPDTSLIDSTIFGNANGAGEENRNVARMATLLAGLPVTIPGSTVNRLCGSGLDATISAAREIETGDAHLVIAGGVESMTRAPWVMFKPEQGFAGGNSEPVSTSLGWRLINPRMKSSWTVSLGEANEIIADQYGIAREAQDIFALTSHVKAHEAWESGFYDAITSQVPGSDLMRDENIRSESSLAELSKLKPVFRNDGTITAGNASPLSDGAGAALIGSKVAAKNLEIDAVFRVASRMAVANEPQLFGVAPIEAANRAVLRAGISWNQVSVVELNEAFAAQSLACIKAWDIDPELVNSKGGAISIGHPLGASGIRLLGTLVERLRLSGGRWGVATLCIGVGQAIAIVIENTHSTEGS